MEGIVKVMNIGYWLKFPMRKQIAVFFILFAFASDLLSNEIQIPIKHIQDHLLQKDDVFQNRFPEYTENGKWIFREKVNWFSGFIAGEFWQMYQMTDNPELKTRALRWADQLVPFADINYTHDMGFIFLPSCLPAYQATGDPIYQKALLKAAEMLAKRYNRTGKFIRAWGSLESNDRAGWMIIDTMMNLELLFWAAKNSGNRDYFDIAYNHALTTLQHAVRNDFSSYHVVEFNAQNGDVLSRRTYQGYADETTWARGQAWGVYGFANAFKHTSDERFLLAAIRMAEYIINHLPQDFIPAWDLNLKSDDVLKDASAGVIFASGLYLLADEVPFREQRERLLKVANLIIESTLSKYLFMHSMRPIEQGILIHCVYNFNKGNAIDESYPAGDYYFMEALVKYWKRQQDKQQILNAVPRQNIRWNDHWYYLEDAAKTIEMIKKSSAKWQCIKLPHTWNQFDATDNTPGYRRSASWYEKKLFVPDSFGRERLLLYFEGANISTDVYVNGQIAGGHVGGYLGFEVDITDFLKKNQENVISVRVDNSYNPDIIPSQKSDFFIYGGITRDVWLKVVPETYLKSCRIQTPNVSRLAASVQSHIEINQHNEASEFQLQAAIFNPRGESVSNQNRKIQLNQGLNEIELKFPSIRNPELWSPEHPYLYTLQVTIKKEDEIIDTIEEHFGLRWFEFKEHGPFYLNGKRLLLRGTHRHEEYAGFGNALPDSLHRKDMEMIKEMGANFVRLAHYPQDPAVYRACDELGLLVWDELPWCRGGMGKEVWKSNTRRLLKEQIIQNYNHPSIILWSLGNELYWLPDFPGGDQIDSLKAFVSELNDLAHQLDPGRLTTLRKFYDGAEITHVFSPSIWAGWYSGVYKTYEQALIASQKKYRRFFHAEYGGSSHVGRHTENPITGEGLVKADEWAEQPNMIDVERISEAGDLSENYIVDLFDWHLMVSEQLDWFTGNAQWAFKDFATPLRPEKPIPYMNQKGLVDRAGKPKDAYYVFKSYWTKNPKFCYIESPTWTERTGKPGETRQVCVYSNCDQVRLVLNNEDQGLRNRNINDFPACGFHWDVLFEAGKNRLIAFGFADGKEVTRNILSINYSHRKHGKPEEIKLSSKKLSNGNYLIEARVVDSQGQLCLDYNKRVYFDHNGSGRLLRNYGTPTRSDVIEFANGKAAIEFVPGNGKAVIEARNQDFKGSYLELLGEKIELNLQEIERERILQKANLYLNERPITITASYCPRSAGGEHDYYSEGDYWWPNPNDPEGPFIRRDGMTNPDNFTHHREYMRRMSIQVAALAAAYKISGDEKYAAHAISHLRAWFLTDSTKMNPHLNYAQAIKGITTGRGVGIIDTIHLVEVARAISILQNSPAISSKDLAGIKNWFDHYLHWMTTSENGINERERKNNHGTCWVMQVAEFARLTGNNDLIDYCRDRFKAVLLPNQMAVDGSFPLELERTKPYGYSLFNLDAMATVCQILSTPKENLWTFELPDGRGMRKAIEFMVPFIEDKSSWRYPPDVMYFDEWPVQQQSLLFAGLALNEEKYIALWKKLKPEPTTDEGLRNFPLRQVILWIDER